MSRNTGFAEYITEDVLGHIGGHSHLAEILEDRDKISERIYESYDLIKK